MRLTENCIISVNDIVHNMNGVRHDRGHPRSNTPHGQRTIVKNLLGLDGQGADRYFFLMAVKDGKPVGGLETSDELMSDLKDVGLFAIGTSSARASEVSESMIGEEVIERLEKAYRKYIGLWKSGSMTTIKATAKNNITLRRRNLRWLPRIEAMFEDADVEYVLVGVGHMYYHGYGLLELLQERGYTVEQL